MVRAFERLGLELFVEPVDGMFVWARFPHIEDSLGLAEASQGDGIMVAPGSVAAAHLHFMLSCQRSTAALPGPAGIERDLSEAGYRVTASQVLVPTEPFVGVLAERR